MKTPTKQSVGRPRRGSGDGRVRDYRTLTLRLPDETRALMDAIREVEEDTSISEMLRRVLRFYVERYLETDRPAVYEKVITRTGEIRNRMQREVTS